MILAQSENLQFKTIRGVLVTANANGFSHILVDDSRQTYFIETGRKSERMNFLIGTRIEIKGLIGPSLNNQPTVHVIQYATADNYSRMP